MAESRRTCSSCGTSNEEDARFCEGCGASLARVCATCGVEANATARFCRGCGAPLEDPAEDVASAARKTVTVLFADLAGSTSFEERVDVETAREVIGHYHDLLRSTAERHRAGVMKYIGDGFMAVWGAPEIGPDDAANAVAAAVELQERFVDLAARASEAHGVKLALRVAVNTGEVVVGPGDADLVGDALNVGARLEAACPLGRVVVGEETWRSTRGRYDYESLGQVQVKGRTAPVAVYQCGGRQSETADAPFVGRADEVRRLQGVLDEAIATRAARLVTVIGDPGVGKSRLAAEFARAHDNVWVIEARCDVEGTVALAPLVEVLRARDLETDVPATISERDRLLRDLNGLVTGVASSVEENFWALRRFVEVMAEDRPVLLVLDDIQWADTLLLDFIEHLAEWVQEVPVLVVALARPELRDIRTDLAIVSRWVSAAVHLDGLDADATAELAAKVLGARELPDELLRRLPSSTGGNPLFVRELVGMLAYDGVLVQEPTGWRLTIDVDAIAVPPTIHALLSSRLERLAAPDRRILEIASVAGSDFSLGAVRALAGGDTAGTALSLNRLRRLELAQPSGAYVGDEPVWRFHHVLIRDVAYRRLLKSDRADLHERLADWVAAGGPGVAFDPDETIARHLEAAHTYRLELGTVDEHTRALALRAARHYAASARRALDRDELVSAGTQAARGAALATADNEVHAELLLIGCEAFLSAGDVTAGAPLVDDLERIAGEALAPWATCYRCQFIVYTDPERLLDVDARLQGAIDEFGQRQDAAGLSKAHRVRASARARLGRIGDCESDLFEALIAARKSGDHRQITVALSAAPGAALWGPSPVPKAGGRCLDVVRMQRMTTAAPSLEATSLRSLAVLELLRGRPDKARTMLAEARQVVADLGLGHGLMETELFAGIIESMDGDLVAAEPHFRTALEGLDALGVGADAGQAAALLARSVLAQGRIDEADRYATESERLAGRNLKTAIAWRAVRAEILAAQGHHNEAADLARDAVAVAAATDLVLDHAEACLALSRVLSAAGDAKGAKGARDDADRLFSAKEVAAAIGRVAQPVVSSTSSTADLTARRLTRTNRASQNLEALISAMNAADIDGVLECYADPFVYDDRRRLSGEPIRDNVAYRLGVERFLSQYSHVDWRTLAVRGDRLHLSRLRASNDDGFETAHLFVHEIGDDGRITYQGRFDEDDFEGAYRELERRFYAGEGIQFAEGGAASNELMAAINNGDYDRLGGELLDPDLHCETRSRSAFPDRSVNDLIANFRDMDAMVATWRMWFCAVQWISPTWFVGSGDREAVGRDGEQYAWSRILVLEVNDGRIATICEFEVDDEDAAFAYSEEQARATISRLAITNRASRTVLRAYSAPSARDVDSPLEWRTLAVRGERLALIQSRCSDDAGIETVHLHVHEIGDDGRIEYEGRFDENDFDGAYRELDRRYYAGEGAPFAVGGSVATEVVIAMNQGDYDRIVRETFTPDIRVESRTRSGFPDRSASDMRDGFGDFDAMVASRRSWMSAACWLSPNWAVLRLDREAVGKDGEQYAWTRLIVTEVRDGRFGSMCEFEVEDEEAAFAYAEERMRATASRLAVTNRSCGTVITLARALNSRDIDSAMANWSDRFVHDSELRVATAQILKQYSHFEWRTVAVRGDRLSLHSSRWSDDAENLAEHLHVYEVDDDGRFAYEGRFDEDDFESAYRELDRRYYADEAAAYARPGTTLTEIAIAANRGDFDRMFGELISPEMRVTNRSSSAFPDRSAAELRAAWEELDAMVAAVREWHSAICWLSPTLCVLRHEREAVGRDGERYRWSRLLVPEFRDGRVSSMCEFEPGDEDAAFAYAEERMRATASRLALTNRASETMDTLFTALQAHDVDGVMRCGGNVESIVDVERILEQYTRFGWRTLAVRGDHLSLHLSSWSDDAGNHTASVHVCEIGDDGRISYDGRFNEDDFDAAYRELERRYYAGEGAEFAEAGAPVTNTMTALHHGDWDRLLGEIFASDVWAEDRSLSAFPDRSGPELRTSWKVFDAMASLWMWPAAVCWLSPNWAVTRGQRETVGTAGEPYAWAKLLTFEVRDGRVASMCTFELEDEEAAFAYVEERMRSALSRLAVTNRASKTTDALFAALRAHDIDGVMKCCSDRVGYDARRMMEQYSKFEMRTLAVRGDYLSLHSSHRSDDVGNETTYLLVCEIGDDGRITYEGRFDDDDFDGAYRELNRRYQARDGAPFAEGISLATEVMVALNQGDFDRMFGELSTPGLCVESRSRSGFPDRSASDLREDLGGLKAMFASARTWTSAECWLSPNCTVHRIDREVVGEDGGRYEWTRLSVTELNHGRLARMCEFEPEDEDAAFAYAEERMRASASRLTLTNRASRTWDAIVRASQAGDVNAMVECYAEPLVYDDWRRLGGNLLPDVRTAAERNLQDYTHFEGRTLAVRGERLHLGSSRWSNNAGDETTYLIVHEVGEDGRFVYEGRFDEDDFTGAYREFTRRYCAGEGEAFAEAAMFGAEYWIAANQGDFERFGELTDPEMRAVNRSSSAFPDCSAAEFRASGEELKAMVASVRYWHAAECWLSSTCGVVRHQREAVGWDGEQYAWTRLLVFEIGDGRCTGVGAFELDDEAAAFAYAEERVRRTEHR